MKFTVRRQDLQQELALGLGVVEAKATIPILSHLLVRADRTGLELLSTDLEIGMRSHCSADVTEPGSAALPAKKLHDVIRALDCDVVSLVSDANNWIRVEGGSYRGRIVGLAGADYPSQPEFPKDALTLKVPIGVLQQMVARAMFAVTTENTRFSINGALLEVDAGGLTLVATDGHRLAHVAWSCELPSVKAKTALLVPRKALMELSRLRPADENEEIEFASAGSHVFFRSASKVIFCRTLEGTFPAYERVIPTGNTISVRAGRKQLQDVIGRVAVLTSDATRMITLQVEGQQLTVTGVNPSMGEATDEMPVEAIGGDVKIGLNYEYLQQFLGVVPSEKVEIQLKDSGTQALLKPVGEGLTYQYVVMPMRLA
jgi:DNA polymerase-3 subunit beta